MPDKTTGNGILKFVVVGKSRFVFETSILSLSLYWYKHSGDVVICSRHDSGVACGNRGSAADRQTIAADRRNIAKGYVSW